MCQNSAIPNSILFITHKNKIVCCSLGLCQQKISTPHLQQISQMKVTSFYNFDAKKDQGII